MIFSFTVFSTIKKVGRLVLNALWASTVESKTGICCHICGAKCHFLCQENPSDLVLILLCCGFELYWGRIHGYLFSGLQAPALVHFL